RLVAGRACRDAGRRAACDRGAGPALVAAQPHRGSGAALGILRAERRRRPRGLLRRRQRLLPGLRGNRRAARPVRRRAAPDRRVRAALVHAPHAHGPRGSGAGVSRPRRAGGLRRHALGHVPAQRRAAARAAAAAPRGVERRRSPGRRPVDPRARGDPRAAHRAPGGPTGGVKPRAPRARRGGGNRQTDSEEARMKAVLALVLVPLVAPAAAAAQELPDLFVLEDRGVPRRVAEHVVAVFEDPATTRWEGGRRLEAGEVVTGNVAARGGLVVLAGRIEGELVVVDGNVEFLPGGAVTGDVTVVRGEVRGVGGGSIGGTLLVYGRAERQGEPGWERRRWGAYRGSPRLTAGDARLVLELGPNYNRVEGLPVAVGPRIETSGRSPLRVEALAILRTEGDRP